MTSGGSRYAIVTRNGVPVAKLVPLRQRVFVPTDTSPDAVVASVKANICRKMRRELVAGSIEGHPIPHLRGRRDRRSPVLQGTAS